ncbi:MAG: NAD-dependent epimerase/dehydratase family protein [Homoserinimonas sp.]
MRLLILGGTEFVGRAFVDQALAADWEVTTLNRGRTPAPEGVIALHGDRTQVDGLAALNDGEWDVVVDTWSWAPVVVRRSATVLRERVEHYVYVSSRSVYADPIPAGADETARLVVADPDDDHFDDYARAKAGSELAVVEEFGVRAVLLRAGLIIGPRENIGRLPWWLNRVAAGGPVLAPGSADAGIQYVDARDLAAFGLSVAKRGHGGPFNVVSPVGQATMGDLLEACVSVTGSGAELRWTDAETILAAGVRPWMDLPIWLPPGHGHEAMHQGDVSKAVADGLRIRPLRETVADTWDWLQSIGGTAPHRADRPRVGLDPAVEAELLGLPQR